MYRSDVLKGQRILVTGGGSGLGKAMAETFMTYGAEVVIAGRRKSVLEEASENLLQKTNGSVEPLQLDIRDPEMVDEVVEQAYRTSPLTGLVNNAAGNFIARTEDVSANGFNAISSIVMNGTFYVTNAVGKRWIRDQRSGAIVSIVTTWVRNGGPFVVPSAMSKAGVHAMTMSLAAEWGRYGIRLNAIAPGHIPTDGMSKRLTPGETPGETAANENPMGRVGTFEELGNLATFLISDGCQWLTGETIAMDGGVGLANGGNFYDLTRWSSAQWMAARDAIESQNQKDKALRR